MQISIKSLLSFALIGLTALTSGCASSEEAERWEAPPLISAEEAPASFEEKLINGQFTQLRPEIGSIVTTHGMCTATLIRADVALTAAHCVGYQDANGGQLGHFRVSLNGGTRNYPINGYRSWVRNGVNERDVALVRLSQPVPTSVAQPTSVARQRPQQGETVTWFGYGCGDRSQTGDSRTGRKQRLTFELTSSANSCPGDSGGPTVVGHNGPVFRVTSGYVVSSGRDIFGDVVALKDELNAQADAWTQAGGQAEQQERQNERDQRADDPGQSNPAPPSSRPEILEARFVDTWAYVVWRAVPGARTYTQFIVVPDRQGGVGAWLYRNNAGRADGDRRAGWFDLHEVCKAIRNKGLGAGPHRLWTQIWPDGDDQRAESAWLPQQIRCR